MAKQEDRNESPINFILQALTKLRFPNVVEAGIMMRMQYETAFGIHNHEAKDDPKVPWPLLAMSPKESLTVVDPLDFRLDQFAENRVHDIFGIAFDDLIQFPRADYLKVIASAKKHSAKLAGTGDRQLRDLEKAMQVIAQQNQQQGSQPPKKS